MARPKKDETPREAPQPPAVPPDAGVSVYRDRAGPQRVAGLSEGKANFAAVTDAAKQSVLVIPSNPNKPAA